MNEMSPARRTMHELYFGKSNRAAYFQYAMLGFDLAVIAFFVGVSFIPQHDWLVAVDLVLAVVMAVDLGLRWWASEDRRVFTLRLTTLADLVVIASLLLPALTESYAFLRILRAVRLLRSYHALRVLCRRSRFFKRHQEVMVSIVNLLIFIFFMTAVVYVNQARENPAIHNYVDALYFTVTTMTTTGFGDITLQGTEGKLLSVLIMMFGISLFVRLAQTIFRPGKVRYECPSCGLLRHDPDAVHCKHCGITIHIRTEGD